MSTDDCDRFLQFHDNLRRNGKFYVFEHGSEDYRLYIAAVAGRPQNIERVFRYCLKTDDVELTKQLFNHVGAKYIFLHFSNLYDPSQSAELGDVKPLFWFAALCGSVQMFKLLAQARLAILMEEKLGKDPTSLTADEYSRLNEACLLSLRAILCHSTFRLRSSPIHIAAAKNHARIVAELLQYGVDPNSVDEHGSTPAILAAAFDCVPVLSELATRRDADLNKANINGFTPVLVASQRGHLQSLQYLHTLHPADFKARNVAGLGCADLVALHNHPHLIPFLSSCQASTCLDLNQSIAHLNVTALTPTTQILPFDTPFLIAARNNHHNVIREFLKLCNKAEIVTKRDKDGMTVLHVAAKNNFPAIIQEVMQNIPNDLLQNIINAEDSTGKTPLYYASLKGFLSVVSLLAPSSDCSYSCRISVSDVRAQSSLLVAAANGHADIVDLLLSQRTDLVNQMDSRGHTAISVASKLGHLNVVKILMKHGADLNLRSYNGGATPLQKAKKYKQERVVEFLTECISSSNPNLLE